MNIQDINDLMTIRNPYKILIIRRDNIGDLVCTTPAIESLRRRYPNAEIGVLVNTYNAGVLLGNPNVDRLFIYKKLKHANGFLETSKAIFLRLKLIIELRSWKPDVALLAKSSFDRHGLAFARQIGAKKIIGFAPLGRNSPRQLPDICLSEPNSSVMHEVEAINKLLTPLNIVDALGMLRVYPSESMVRRISGDLPNAPYRIALHISAREPERRWGVQNFVAISEELLKRDAAMQILLFWSPGKKGDLGHPGDDEIADQILQKVNSERLVPMAPSNIPELVAGLSVCDFFIGADGGAMHLAVGLGKPIVGLFEKLPSKLNHWYPWRVPSRVLHGDRIEVGSIQLRAVLDAVSSLRDETQQ